jgi:hypothetical protein
MAAILDFQYDIWDIFFTIRTNILCNKTFYNISVRNFLLLVLSFCMVIEIRLTVYIVNLNNSHFEFYKTIYLQIYNQERYCTLNIYHYFDKTSSKTLIQYKLYIKSRLRYPNKLKVWCQPSWTDCRPSWIYKKVKFITNNNHKRYSACQFFKMGEVYCSLQSLTYGIILADIFYAGNKVAVTLKICNKLCDTHETCPYKFDSRIACWLKY